jgi:hypothetical protein
MVRHGQGRSSVFLVCVARDPELENAIEETTGEAPHILTFGKRQLIPLPLDKGATVGQISDSIYDAESKRWTATIAVYRYR